MAAPAEQMTRGLDEPRRAEIVVAVQGGGDAGEALRAGQRIGRQLGAAYPSRPAVVLLLSDGANEPIVAPDGRAQAAFPVLPWTHAGQTPLEATLRAAEAFEAAACALVVGDGEGVPVEGARALLAPVLDDGYDLVSPCYAAHRFEGVLTTGIVYPLTRALFGQRLRQPIGRELAVSRRLSAHLLGEGWTADAPHAGEGIWLVTAALSREFRVCQAWLGARPPRRQAEANVDLPDLIARVVGLLFHEMRLHVEAWQRVKGSHPLQTYGAPQPPPGEPGQPQVASMITAFQLGYQELGRLWSALLPPQSLLALKRLAREPEERFALDDALWARIVYDFAVGYHLGTLDRTVLLRSMTPLYLGWAAGFVREARELDQEGVEARVERLCCAFEAAKRYLISRWRWPDRFNP